MSQVPENRGFPRIAVNCEIACRPLEGGETRRVVAKNISGNGIFLVASEPLEKGAVMEITVSPGMLSIPPLNAIVEVVRVAPSPARSFGEEDPPGPCYGIGARIVSMN